MDPSLLAVAGVAQPGALMCIECEDVPANVYCQRCEEVFCGLCFQWLHRKGKRQQHTVEKLQQHAASGEASSTDAGPIEGTTEYFIQQQKKQQQQQQQQQQTMVDADAMALERELAAAIAAEKDEAAARGDDNGNEDDDSSDHSDGDEAEGSARGSISRDIMQLMYPDGRSDVHHEMSRLAQRAEFVPLRLSEEERVLLRLLEGALEVSEYTDKVDVSNDYYGWTGTLALAAMPTPLVGWRSATLTHSLTHVMRLGTSYYGGGTSSKTDTIRRELEDFFSIISGLLVANDFRAGSSHTVGRSFQDNAELFQRVFELGRRFKIMNPDKMRTTYGKMMHLLQDAGTPGMLNFSCISEIRTVRTLLRDRDALDMLADPNLLTATFVSGSRRLKREELQRLQQARNDARQALIKRYGAASGGALTDDEVQLCIDSISDSNSFIASNRDPVDGTLRYLVRTFRPEQSDEALAIRAGRGGSCLTHTHATQFRFVQQSLLLWREIQGEMFRLWMLTDSDLLDARNRYRLANTGQGLNRVQPAPHISRAMSEILGRVQSHMRGGWVGLSVVHLGDRDVPNAMVFIDKYTQVPRILGPVVRTLDNIPAMLADPNMRELLENKFQGVAEARLMILRDYFRHGFDGSGSDGGSCIDGRLTSSWNWCSQLEKKPYHAIFLLACFDGFDGSFKNQSI